MAKLTAEQASVSARNQMAFQERMSSTAHQRETKDLIAAGLNPVLSAGGSGASTPSGAEGDISNDQIFALLGQVIETSAKQAAGMQDALNYFASSSGEKNDDVDPFKDWTPETAGDYQGMKDREAAKQAKYKKTQEAIDKVFSYIPVNTVAMLIPNKKGVTDAQQVKAMNEGLKIAKDALKASASEGFDNAMKNAADVIINVVQNRMTLKEAVNYVKTGKLPKRAYISSSHNYQSSLGASAVSNVIMNARAVAESKAGRAVSPSRLK